MQLMLYSSSAATGSFFDIHDAVIGLIEPAEVDGTVEDGPDLFGDLLESDDGVFEETAHEDFAHLPAKGVIARDAAELEVGRVLEGLGVIGEGPGRG